MRGGKEDSSTTQEKVNGKYTCFFSPTNGHTQLSVSCLREKKELLLSYTGCIILLLDSFYHHVFFSLLVFINLYLQNKKKRRRNDEAFFFSLFCFYNVILACKLYPCYLPFFAIFTVILSEYSQISLIWLCFFFSKKVHYLTLV